MITIRAKQRGVRAIVLALMLGTATLGYADTGTVTATATADHLTCDETSTTRVAPWSGERLSIRPGTGRERWW